MALLDLVKRAIKGTPLTTTEHDQNLTDIETEVNALIGLVDGEDVDALEQRVGQNESDIGDLNSAVGTNTSDISDNVTAIGLNTTHRGQTDNPHSVTASQVGLGSVANAAQLKSGASDFHTNFSNKSALVDEDEVIIEDSEAGYAKKNSTWANIKAVLLDYFDGIYSTLTHASQHTDGTDDIQSATNAQKGLATDTHITQLESNTSKLSGIEAGADVTDADNVSAAGAVMTETDPVFTSSEAASFEAGDKDKLDGIEAGANNFSLPSQTGNSGKVLGTDGTDPLWQAAAAGSGGFEDRGDPADPDFILSGLTTDGTWHDLDCSSVVPAGAVGIVIRATVNDNATNSYLNFRKNGNSNTAAIITVRTQVADVPADGNAIVPCDSNRIIEYQAANTTFTSIAIVIIGWFL